jgi:hypothetical protein
VHTTTLEDISADRHAGSTKLHRSRAQRTSSVTASGTSSDVTSALRLISMPESTPATASTWNARAVPMP